jgi:hypothetical protein
VDRIGYNSEKRLNNSQTMTPLEVENKSTTPCSSKKVVRKGPEKPKITFSFLSPFSLRLFQASARTRKNRSAKVLEAKKNERAISIGGKA